MNQCVMFESDCWRDNGERIKLSTSGRRRPELSAQSELSAAAMIDTSATFPVAANFLLPDTHTIVESSFFLHKAYFIIFIIIKLFSI